MRSLRALRARSAAGRTTLTPWVLLFALVQAFSPALASIADAWRADQRTPYAHMEAETGAGCVVVHEHDCALCSVVSANASLPIAHAACVVTVARRAPLPAVAAHTPTPSTRAAPHPRGPPGLPG